jgi:hypothetical protein
MQNFPVFQAAAARLNAMGDQATRVLADLKALDRPAHEVMARPICPFPSPASCVREMKRIGEQESAEDEYLSHVAMLEDAAMHIRSAQKALTKAGAVDDEVCKHMELAITELGGKVE